MSWTSLYEIAPLRTLLKKYVDFRRRPITFPCSKETGLHSPFLLTRLVHFYVAIWHNLSSRSIATRCRQFVIAKYRDKVQEVALRERIRTIIRQVCKELGVQIVSGVLSRENMSICWWKSRRIIPSATSCGASRDAHHIGCRGSSRTFDWHTALFVANPTDASMWGAYGDGHRGACLKFRTLPNKEECRTLDLYRANGWGGGKDGNVTTTTTMSRTVSSRFATRPVSPR
jgi:hypothetical protein